MICFAARLANPKRVAIAALDPARKWLWCANQDSQDVVSFAIAADGTLTQGTRVQLPGCPNYVTAPTGKNFGGAYGHGASKAGLSRKVLVPDASLGPVPEPGAATAATEAEAEVVEEGEAAAGEDLTQPAAWQAFCAEARAKGVSVPGIYPYSPEREAAVREALAKL